MPSSKPVASAGRTLGVEPTQPPQGGSPAVAALWMLGALSSFVLMAVSGREISKELDTFQLMFFRSVIGLAIVIGIGAVLSGGLKQFRTTRLRAHGVRNLFHFVGQFSWFFAISQITLAEVFAIEFTTPIWVAVLAPFLLAERMTWYRAVAVSMGFAGVLVVLRPGVGAFEAGHGAMLIGALGFAVAMLMTKRLSSTESPLSILFWMAVIQAPMGLIGSLSDFRLPGLETSAWLVLVTLFGLSAHYCLAQAIRRADASLVAPMDFFRLPLIAIVGMLLYAEPLDPFVFIGGAVILAGNWINIRFSSKAAT